MTGREPAGRHASGGVAAPRGDRPLIRRIAIAAGLALVGAAALAWWVLESSGVAIIDGRATVEASGGVSLETVGDIAATGVDVISVGALTHSARNLDLGLDIGLGHRPGTGTG